MGERNLTNPANITDMANLITTAEAARRLGTSVSNVNRWASCGVIPVAWKAPGRLGPRYFRAEDIEGLTYVRGGLKREA